MYMIKGVRLSLAVSLTEGCSNNIFLSGILFTLIIVIVLVTFKKIEHCFSIFSIFLYCLFEFYK